MPSVNLRQLAGYWSTTFTGLVRAILDVYTAVAAAESIDAPAIRACRRGALIDGGPNSIVLEHRRGPWSGVEQSGHGEIGAVQFVVIAHIWAPEPTIGADDLENELLRFDSADPMLDRFLNVLNRVAVGRYEPIDIDPDAGQGSAGSVNEHGETYVVAFRFKRPIPRDATVFAVLPDQDSDGQPTPKISPAPSYATAASSISTVTPTTEIQE